MAVLLAAQEHVGLGVGLVVHWLALGRELLDGALLELVAPDDQELVNLIDDGTGPLNVPLGGRLVLVFAFFDVVNHVDMHALVPGQRGHNVDEHLLARVVVRPAHTLGEIVDNHVLDTQLAAAVPDDGVQHPRVYRALLVVDPQAVFEQAP